MIILKTSSQVDQIVHNGQVLRQAVNAAQAASRPGTSTAQLNQIIEDIITANGATPTFKGYRGFPAASCISINNELVHGIPGKRKLKDGDVVSIDIGVTKNGCIADSCYSYAVGEITSINKELIKVAHDTTIYGISLCKPGARIHDIAKQVFEFVNKTEHFTIAQGLYGHGTGTQLHEPPTICFTYPCPEIPNVRLSEDMVITIEPVICFKSSNGKYTTAKDGWTVNSSDGSFGAQFEHTLQITKDGYKILTGEFYTGLSGV